MNVQQLLVEGGEKVITSFLKQNLVDEIVVYTSNEKLGGQGKVPSSQTMRTVYNRLKKNYSDKKIFGKDVKLTDIVK
jgi:riboflavin biosynthesis pyrimidine reductase